MSDMTIEQFCNKHNACKEGHDWAIANFTSIQDAWDNATDYEYALWTVTQPGVLTYCELRLFACWCARQVWDLLTDERSRKAVEVAERFANGNATADELITANDAARAAARAAAGDVEMQWQSERVRAILNRAEPEKVIKNVDGCSGGACADPDKPGAFIPIIEDAAEPEKGDPHDQMMDEIRVDVENK